MFVYRFLCVGRRLKTPKYILLLQNPQASVHYYLYLSETTSSCQSLVNLFSPNFGTEDSNTILISLGTRIICFLHYLISGFLPISLFLSFRNRVFLYET
jgi:hypothetical protein